MSEVSSVGTPAPAPWFRGTVGAQLSVFAIPAISAWTTGVDREMVLPLVALPLGLAVGLVLLVLPGRRDAGWRIALGSVVAAGLELGLTFALIVAYGQTHEWDLS